MRKNIFFVFYLLMVLLVINGCLSYDDMQLNISSEQTGTIGFTVGTFSFPKYNYGFQLTRGDGDTDNNLFEISGKELRLKSNVTPTTKEYSVRVAMGASSTAGGMQKIFTFYLPVREMPQAILAQQQLQEQPRPAAPSTFSTEDDFNIMQNTRGTITITGYHGTATQVVIPETIEGIKITEIGSGAFYGKRLISVTFPDSITSIGPRAFEGNQLTNITIPNDVTFIGRGAFASNQLTSIIIPNGVREIGNEGGQLVGSFQYNNLTSVTIPDSVISIGYAAFRNNQLTSITIPNGVVEIGSYAFGYNQLSSVIIPDSVRTVGYFSFVGNENLSSFSISNRATRAETPFFNQPLTNITLPADYSDNNLQVFPNNLRAYYISQNRKAGTYIWSGRIWRVE